MNKPYPKYKPSGVEWLGDVPEHWSKFRISDLARYGKKTFIDGDWIESPYITDDGVRLLQTGNVGIGKYKEQGYRYISEETFKELDCTEINPGDVLICRLADPVGRACIAPKLNERMITSVDVAILKLRPQHLNKYIVYALSSDQYLNYLAMLCRGGTRDRVSRSMLGQIRISLPPLPEQQAIAAFLDRETGRIDALIAKKERLLELLAEQRTALISRAVTKGLDASVKLKPSGVEWLGDVPEHWEVKKLKYVSNTNTGFAFSSDDYTDEGIPLIRIGDILQDGNVDIANAKKLPEEYLRTYLFVAVNKNDMLMAMTGATIGKAGRYQFDEKGLLNQRVCKFVPFKIFADFFWFILKSEQYAEHIKLTGFGGAQPNISDVQLLDFHFALPPLPEQQDIAAFLDHETAKINALSAKVTTVIERLKEYRTALISSAVTGKIDVREAV